MVPEWCVTYLGPTNAINNSFCRMVQDTSSETSYLDSLPDHIICYILSFVDQNDVYSVRQVCKRFTRLANETIRRVQWNLSNNVDIQRAVQMFPMLEGLRVVSENALLGWLNSLQELPRLMSVSLKGVLLEKRDMLALSALKQLRCLECEDVEFCESISDAHVDMNHVETLRIVDCREMCHLDMVHICNDFNGLRELSLQGMELSDQMLTYIGSLDLRFLNVSGSFGFTSAGLGMLKSGGLKSLLVSACRNLDDSMCRTIVDVAPGLEVLGIFENDVSAVGLGYLSKLSQLKVLDCGYIDGDFSSADLESLILRCKMLEVLNISGVTAVCDRIMRALSSCKYLKRLDVSECAGIHKAGFQSIAHLKSLEELSVGWNGKLTNDSLRYIPEGVEILDLSYASKISDAGLQHLRRLGNLRVLKLHYCHGIRDHGLDHIAQCHSLTHLDVGLTRLSSKGFAKLHGLQHLYHLDMRGCVFGSTVLGLASLCRIRSLKSLSLSGNHGVDDGCLQAISFHSGLRTIHMRQCRKVSDHGILALARMKCLERVDITGCSRVTRHAIEKLSRQGVMVTMSDSTTFV